MNDPEVMERIAAALEKIAWILGGSEWLSMLNHAKFAVDIIQGIVLAIMKLVHVMDVVSFEVTKNE